MVIISTKRLMILRLFVLCKACFGLERDVDDDEMCDRSVSLLRYSQTQ